jgi:hypothetical protein
VKKWRVNEMILIDKMGYITSVITMYDCLFVGVVSCIGGIFLICIWEYFKKRKKVKPNDEGHFMLLK